MPPSNEIVFHCRTLTPIWTGDIDRNSEEVKESGILGSLRFWYEGILRANGVYVCGTLGQKEDCNCPVCELFGRTGLARKFRLTVEGLEKMELFFQSNDGVKATHGAWLNGIYTGKMVYSPDMRFGKSCLWASNGFQMKFHFRIGSRYPFYIPILSFLLSEMSTKGGIGAKTQHGFGQIELLKRKELDPLIQYGRTLAAALAKTGNTTTYNSGEFTLNPNRFFSLLFEGNLPDRYKPGQIANIGGQPPSGTPFVSCAFDIRYRDLPDGDYQEYAGLRPTLKTDFPGQAKRMLGEMGFTSRIHVSHLYKAEGGKYRLKIWGDVDQPEAVKKSVVDYVGAALDWNLVA